MNDLLRRRRAMMGAKSDVPNTSPRIDQRKHAIGRWGSIVEDENCCVTEWITVYPVPHFYSPSGRRPLLYSGIPYNEIDRKHELVKEDETMERSGIIAFRSGTVKMRFTLFEAELNTCYCYDQVDGQILFAGKDSPYYGYTNINDMPTGT